LRRPAIILPALFALFLAGCNEQQATAPVNEYVAGPVDVKPTGELAEMLAKEPSVEKVERWDNFYVDGLIITTEHYRIHSTLTDLIISRRLPVFLEALHREFRGASGVRSLKAGPNPIYIFETRQQWEMFSEGFTLDYWPYFKNIRNGAFYHNGACVAYNLGLQNTLSLLAHECWHQFSRRHFAYQLPAWVDEAMAMSVEGFRYEGNMYSFSTSYNKMRVDGLKTAARQNYDMSFRELLGINPAQLFKDADPSRVNAYYSKLFAFIRFLREYGDKEYAPKLTQLLHDGYYGKWNINENYIVNLRNRNMPLTGSLNRLVGVELFEEYFGSNYSSMEKEFSAFVYSLLMDKPIGGQDIKNAGSGEPETLGTSMYSQPDKIGIGTLSRPAPTPSSLGGGLGKDGRKEENKRPALGTMRKSDTDGPGL
jgi:hypothetical protein